MVKIERCVTINVQSIGPEESAVFKSVAERGGGSGRARGLGGDCGVAATSLLACHPGLPWMKGNAMICTC